MRLIGYIEDKQHALRFHDYLYAKSIENEMEQESDDRWAVWVLSEDQLEAAEKELHRFNDIPDAPEFQKVASIAHEKRAAIAAQQKAAEKRRHDRGRIWPESAGLSAAPLTAVLIVVSVFVAIMSNLGNDTTAIQSFFVSKYQAMEGAPWWSALIEIQQGEIWRIFTPIFIHFGLWHLLFNMLWLRDLGGMIESRLGSMRLALMIVVVAGLSNMAQFAVSGPLFGGMSGVVYGLLGYIWLRGKFDPGSGLFLHQSTVTMMIVWFFLCLTGIMGPIANTVHAVGLFMGMAWGYLSALHSKPKPG